MLSKAVFFNQIRGRCRQTLSDKCVDEYARMPGQAGLRLNKNVGNTEDVKGQHELNLITLEAHSLMTPSI